MNHQSKNQPAKLSLAAALARDSQRLREDAEAQQAEIDRVFDLLMQEPERWDGLS